MCVEKWGRANTFKIILAAMTRRLLLLGDRSFEEQLSAQLKELNTKVNSLAVTEDTTLLETHLPHTDVVFIKASDRAQPAIEACIKAAKNIVLFEIARLTSSQLNDLLNLALESKSCIVNGDALLFNPVVYHNIKQIAKPNLIHLKRNDFNSLIKKQNIFACVELALWKARNQVKNLKTKGVQLHNKSFNIINLRIDFENDSAATVEIRNTQNEPELKVEAVNGTNILFADLLKQQAHFEAFAPKGGKEEFYKAEGKIQTERSDKFTNLFNYIDDGINSEKNEHAHFQNAIEAVELIGQMEEQLNRSFAEFSYFEA